MSDALLLALVFVAIAIGWYLGRRGSLLGATRSRSAVDANYYKGLNYLINEQPDSAIDAFIDALEVNTETLDTHIAVGNLMRRKGEVERAIRVHQNLLSRPSLPREYMHQAHLELARDFISAGLFDRAEGLLQDLLDNAPELREVTLRHLLEIYQDEKEWQRAIDIGKKLLPKRSILKSHAVVDSDIPVALAHYCCEMAEGALLKNDYHSVRLHLKKALAYDRSCVRALLLLARVEHETGHYGLAIKALRAVREQDPVFLSEAIELLRSCFERLGQPENFQTFLQASLNEAPSATVILALVDDIRSRKGDAEAVRFIEDQLKRRPSLRGLDKLVDIQIANSSGSARENLKILHVLLQQLMHNKPHYRCRHCGFAGKQLHWICPGCKRWGEISAIRGAEGE